MSQNVINNYDTYTGIFDLSMVLLKSIPDENLEQFKDQYYHKDIFMREFRTIKMHGPRQTGKSHFMLNKAQELENSCMIVPSVDARDILRRNFLTYLPKANKLFFPIFTEYEVLNDKVKLDTLTHFFIDETWLIKQVEALRQKIFEQAGYKAVIVET